MAAEIRPTLTLSSKIVRDLDTRMLNAEKIHSFVKYSFISKLPTLQWL